MLEDFVTLFNSLLDDFVGPKGRKYLPIVGSMFLLILISNLAGMVPGLMAPTSNVNVTLGCALTVWVFYHIEGIREQGIVSYVKHFLVLPGAPGWMVALRRSSWSSRSSPTWRARCRSRFDFSATSSPRSSSS